MQIVGILILIYQHIPELPLIVASDLFLFLKKDHCLKDQVVKIQSVGGFQTLFIFGVDGRDALKAVIPRSFALLLIVGGQLQGILGPGDIPQYRLGRKRLIVYILLLQNILDHPFRVGGIIDGEGGRIPQFVNVPAQDPGAAGMEGGGPDVVGAGAQHPFQPFLQLPRRLVGEGDGQNGPGGGRLHPAEFLCLFLPLRSGLDGIAFQKA